MALFVISREQPLWAAEILAAQCGTSILVAQGANLAQVNLLALVGYLFHIHSPFYRSHQLHDAI
jgi:hypothetical protein